MHYAVKYCSSHKSHHGDSDEKHVCACGKEEEGGKNLRRFVLFSERLWLEKVHKNSAYAEHIFFHECFMRKVSSLSAEVIVTHLFWMKEDARSWSSSTRLSAFDLYTLTGRNKISYFTSFKEFQFFRTDSFEYLLSYQPEKSRKLPASNPKRSR